MVLAGVTQKRAEEVFKPTISSITNKVKYKFGFYMQTSKNFVHEITSQTTNFKVPPLKYLQIT